MRYYQIVQDGYIVAFGVGPGGEAIAKERYDALRALLAEKPAREGTTDHRLREDLTWEPYEVEPTPDPDPEDEVDAAEALSILLGGAS